MSKKVILEMSDINSSFSFDSTIETELNRTQLELETLNENLQSLKILKPECDKIDYMLSVSSGALCGIIDIFLVGKPGDSKLEKLTDTWFKNRTKDFARLSGWKGGKDGSSSAAIRFLEKKYKVPYDQRGAGDIGANIFELTPSNHHFKSLAHNPSILGLFFSILDQYMNTSSFVSNGELVTLQNAGDKLELRGSSNVSKIFSGIVNWIGHLMSDVSGSSTSKGRGMGIPSPLWTWTNDIIAIKSKLGIPTNEFDKSVNELAIKLFNEGYDFRFQAAQAIPVLINEMIVRFFYSVRRMVQYFASIKKENRNFKDLWTKCEPFSNPTVKRMLTIAHGTFCLIDIGDATIRGALKGGATINGVSEFFMRLNIVGLGRFTISIYGEVKTGVENNKNERLRYNVKREKEIVIFYLKGLEELSEKYNDAHLIQLIKDFTNSDIYKEAFSASVELAEKREVPKEKILYTKEDGDKYFRSDNNGKERD